MNLSKESVRLPLYRAGPAERPCGTSCSTRLTPGSRTISASTTRRSSATSASAAPPGVQTVTLDSPTPDQNRFGQAVVNFQGAPDFSPTRIAQPGPTGFPLAKFQPGAVAGPGYSPFIRIAGLADGLQRADRRHRRRSVRRRPPHGHRRPGARHPHRRQVGSRTVCGVVGRPAVREGLRRRTADHLHLHRRRPAAERGARALDIRAGARQGRLQRRGRLPRLRPRAAVRVRERTDRLEQHGVAGLRPSGQGRPRVRGRERRQHRR